MKLKLLPLITILAFSITLIACQDQKIDSRNGSSSTAAYPQPFIMESDLPSGGSTRTEMCTQYQTLFYGLDTFLNEIVGQDALDTWASQFEDGRNKWECTTYNAVRELNISKEDFIIANKGITYTPYQIDAIFSDDINLINQAFINDYALLIGDKIYTPDWLATHTISNYEQSRIDANELMQYLDKIDVVELERETLAIKANLSRINPAFVDNNSLARNQYEIDFYSMPDFIHELIPSTEYEAWASRFIVENNNEVRDMSEFNIINIVRELNIKKSDFIKANAQRIYTEEQIEAIYFGSNDDINGEFSQPKEEMTTTADTFVTTPETTTLPEETTTTVTEEPPATSAE